MAQVTPPENWKISPSLNKELPEEERKTAADVLWEKSAGRCSLCNDPLPPDGVGVQADHKIARVEGDGGETTLANLHLAHRACNTSRKNLSFPIAQAVIRFARWCKDAPRRSFGDVVKAYVPNGNRRVEVVRRTDTEIELDFGGLRQVSHMGVDPATKTPYFFMDVPIDYIQNDDDSQPRFIEHDHVRTLAVEFSERPVHEPSNCRMVSSGADLVDLLQFDGQHKTTAQIILGRAAVPMKFYVDPDPAMIQELVVQIQQGIKKRPLSTTDTLRKLDDVIRDKIEEFKKQNGGRYPTERELVEAQPKQDQTQFKKRLINNFEYLVLSDAGSEISKFVSTKPDRQKPLTDKVVLNKLIKPLVSQELLDEPLDETVQRDTERDTVVWILSLITDLMLNNWQPKAKADDENLDTQRARTFFYQGAIGWWTTAILIPGLQGIIQFEHWKRWFLQPLNDDQREKIEAYLKTLTTWPIWSTKDPVQIAALRSNTVQAVSQAFSGYGHLKLMEDTAANKG